MTLLGGLIGISGKAQHGKDTVCAEIEAVLGRRGIRVVRVGFADALKSDCRARGWNGEKDEAGRAMLQDEGVRRRAENVDYWVDRMFATILDDPLHRSTIFVVPDVRFTNEAEAISAAGGEVWRVERYLLVDGEHVPWENSLPIEQKSHPSEIDLDGYRFDVKIENPDENPRLLSFRVGYALAMRRFVP